MKTTLYAKARTPAQGAVSPAADASDPHALGLEDADGFYEQLLDAHAGLSREQSEALNARLVLLLANQVGSARRLSNCISAAIRSGE